MDSELEDTEDGTAIQDNFSSNIPDFGNNLKLQEENLFENTNVFSLIGGTFNVEDIREVDNFYSD